MKEKNVLPLKLLKSGGARAAPPVFPVPPTLSSPFVLLLLMLVTASSFEGGGRRSQTTEPFLKEKYKKCLMPKLSQSKKLLKNRLHAKSA